MTEVIYKDSPRFYGICPQCNKRYLEPLPDTEWVNGKEHTIEVFCPNCLHRETISLSKE